jgi:glucose-6-phosphate 1-dehydrogenase
VAAPVTVENPVRQGLRLARTPEPWTMVICGASDDLTRRTLIAALYNLVLEQWLPAGWASRAARTPRTIIRI